MQNTRCGWAAGPRGCSLGPYFLPFDQFSAPVASPRRNKGHFILWHRQKDAQGSSQLFALSVLSEKIKPLPANSRCTPYSHVDHQLFSSSLHKSHLGCRLSRLSGTSAGDLALCLLRGRLFSFEGGRNPSCCPLRAPQGFLPFSHRFVPPPSVPTRGRAR